MALTQIITWVNKYFVALHTFPTKYQYLIGIAILILTSRVFDAIIDVGFDTMHSPKY